MPVEASAKVLADYFKGANPDDHRLSSFIMVGGIPDKETVVSSIDLNSLRSALHVFEQWDVPVSAELENFRVHKAPAPRDAITAINILPQHGGQDFLTSSAKGDVVVLCNIARDVDDSFLLSRDNDRYFNNARSTRESFTSSAEHRNIAKWHDQIAKADAKIVIITNSDGFELAEMNNGNYVQIALPTHGMHDSSNVGMLVRRDYLSNLADYLAVRDINGQGSPLLSIAMKSLMEPETRFSFHSVEGRVLQFAA